MTSVRRIVLFVFYVALTAAAEAPLRVFVADLNAASVTLAWGRAMGGYGQNTIGRNAGSSGVARIEINGKSIETTASSYRVEGLKPDTVYPYSVSIDGTQITNAIIRTWPEKAESLTFFVIGDFGNGSSMQYATARRMEEERLRRDKAGQIVRFVLSTGDNLYGVTGRSGSKDRDWEKKYFQPYADTLAAIPFKAVLGNHDGNESESTRDLEVCLDNFFMPARWYRFEYAGFAEFFGLDSTTNQPEGPPAPMYAASGDQSKWLAKNLAEQSRPWRLVWMHHPMFTAGPTHQPFLAKGRHWFDLFRSNGVQAVFAGHEHNLQISEQNEHTGGIPYVVSGAGGELRRENVQKRMAAAHIAAWSNQSHFLAVTLDPTGMTIEAFGSEPIRLTDPAGKSVSQPLKVSRKSVPLQETTPQVANIDRRNR